MGAASPFLILLIVWLFHRKGSPPLPYLAALSAVAMIIGVLIYHLGGPLKPPYRFAVELVEGQIRSDDIILHTSDGSYPASDSLHEFEQSLFT